MRKRAQLLPLTVLVVACASSKPTISQSKSDLTASDTMAEQCPMKVPGTKVVSVDVEGGAALLFSTTGDSEALRQHSRHMAAMHNEMSGEGTMINATGPASGKPHHLRRHMAALMMPDSMATAEDIDGGAKLVFRPKDPQKLEALRASVRLHAEKMNGGKCLMAESLPYRRRGGTQP
jgi:hypothetical protein